MYRVIEKAIIFLRYGFLVGIVFAAVVSVIKGKNILLYGYMHGAVCVFFLIVSKGAVVALREKVGIWAPGTWGDLKPEDYKKIPIILKIVILFQHISLFYLAFVFGWFMYSMIYFWIK